jgi:hypothetical protein
VYIPVDNSLKSISLISLGKIVFITIPLELRIVIASKLRLSEELKYAFEVVGLGNTEILLLPS